ncbi:MAG TPA: sporulation integral membrane protein YlbJ [Bacillales bacterium]|nr:sporulation integral membrane protein YlbJ [Bacillales bacterium]
MTTCALTIAASLMIFPKAAYEASLRGLEMWWDVVFPSLLPFFIMSELLIGFGVVHLLGAVFEPFMRPLFRVPGAGGFVWAMGIASGYPAGAKLTARLRQEGQLTKLEAERLASFTNFSNPLFMFGAVAVGFFHNASLGLILAASHYLGNFCVGLVMRFYGKGEERVYAFKGYRKASIRKAIDLIHHERQRDRRPLGKLLGDAVSSSVSTLLTIGGFVILFSVINRVFELLHITDGLAAIVSFILNQLHIPPELSHALVSGLFEITLGAQTASQTDTFLFYQIMVTSFILAFCGFSVQAQVASILADTDIRFKPFFLARGLHGIFASLFTLILWNPLFVERTAGKSTVTVDTFETKTAFPVLQSAWEHLLHYGALVSFVALLAYMAITIGKMKKNPLT